MFRGVAARALHLSRGVEKPSGRVTYIVVLEGLCRFSVQELSTRGSYHVARVSRLDMTKTELEQAEQDPDLIALSRQFKATAMELISVLEQVNNLSRNLHILFTCIRF
jgi:ATP-dependent Lon protease